MAGPAYEPGRYVDQDRVAIETAIAGEGWAPVLIADPPGAVYPPHRHAAAKLLVVLTGGMEVQTGETRLTCRPGDRLVIPGWLEHAAQVGPEGCLFFWSEQRREVR